MDAGAKFKEEEEEEQDRQTDGQAASRPKVDVKEKSLHFSEE